MAHNHGVSTFLPKTTNPKLGKNSRGKSFLTGLGNNNAWSLLLVKKSLGPVQDERYFELVFLSWM